MSEQAVATPGSTDREKRKRRPTQLAYPSELPPVVTASKTPNNKSSAGKSSTPTTTKELALSPSIPLVMRLCAKVHRLVADYSRLSWPFLEPVDPVALGIPDYPDVIRHPMDLGTIERKLLAGVYGSADAFVADMRLVFDNAKTYNPPDHDVHKMAVQLETFFDSKYSQIMARELPPEEKPAAKREREKDNAKDKERDAKEKERELQKERKREAHRERLEKEKRKDEKTIVVVPMTYEEKVSLTKKINELNEEELVQVARIIQAALGDDLQKAETDDGEDDEEIEVDMEKLDAVTLRRLEKYVNGQIRKRERERKGDDERKTKRPRLGHSSSSANLKPGNATTPTQPQQQQQFNGQNGLPHVSSNVSVSASASGNTPRSHSDDREPMQIDDDERDVMEVDVDADGLDEEDMMQADVEPEADPEQQFTLQ
jgi:hypothetical protein